MQEIFIAFAKSLFSCLVWSTVAKIMATNYQDFEQQIYQIQSQALNIIQFSPKNSSS